MGQSFGGFCAITYLSFYSEGLKDVFITGGLAPLVDHPDPDYEWTVRMSQTRLWRYVISRWPTCSIKGGWLDGTKYTTKNTLGIRNGSVSWQCDLGWMILTLGLKVRDICAFLDENEVILPNGGRLSVRRFQQLGLDFGMQGRSFSTILYEMTIFLSTKRFSRGDWSCPSWGAIFFLIVSSTDWARRDGASCIKRPRTVP
jgi:hypothetical protein